MVFMHAVLYDPYLQAGIALKLCLRRFVLSRFFKNDRNNDYGTYAEGGDITEMIDRNPAYESTAAENQDKAAKKMRPRSDYENWEDEYDYMGEHRERSKKKMRPHSDYENWEDEYDQMGEEQSAKKRKPLTEDEYDHMYEK